MRPRARRQELLSWHGGLVPASFQSVITPEVGVQQLRGEAHASPYYIEKGSFGSTTKKR